MPPTPPSSSQLFLGPHIHLFTSKPISTMLKLNISSSIPSNSCIPHLTPHARCSSQKREHDLFLPQSSHSDNFAVLLILTLNVSQIRPWAPCALPVRVQVSLEQFSNLAPCLLVLLPPLQPVLDTARRAF